MFNGGNGFSLADIAAAVGGNRNGGGFGDGNGAWWVLIILLAMWGGFGDFGNNGNGNGRGNSNGGGTNVIYPEVASMQRGFDTSSIITKLDGLNSGICSLGYDQLAQMNNLGTQIQGVGTQVMQTGNAIQQAINADTVANMQNTNALSTQLAGCCCDMRAAIKDVQYTIGQDSCATQAAIHQVGDNVIQSQNWGFRNLQDTITQGFQNLENQANQRYIRELEAKLNACDRDNALQGMANYIINTTNPRAVPAYPACNPNGVGNWASSVLAGGSSNNCGCCNNF